LKLAISRIGNEHISGTDSVLKPPTNREVETTGDPDGHWARL